MAVVSLSRIQIRRGNTNGQPLPQLASGELAWAIDTQGLYIGNGSLNEGAPETGNTKILTEHDNIFELTDSYTYKKELVNGIEVILPGTQGRTLQQRLDDYVSIRAFGGTGDSSDHSTILQTAIDRLFKLSQQLTVKAFSLYIEPGTYMISRPILLPPRTVIQGAGKGRTIFKIADNAQVPFTEVFITIDESFIGADSNIIYEYPRNIKISNMTIDVSQANATTKSIFFLEGCNLSDFSNIEFIGDSENIKHVGFHIQNGEFGDDFIRSKHNLIENNSFVYMKQGIYSPSSIEHNTIRNCVFEANENSIVIEDIDVEDNFEPTGNIVENCWFDRIEKSAIITNGRGNVSRNNKFNSVGNDIEGKPLYPVIEFLTPGNASDGDWFLRTYNLMNTETDPYLPEVKGIGIYENKFRYQRTVAEYDTPSKIINLSMYNNQTVEIQYKYKSNIYTAFRSGTLTINVNSATGQASMNDEFDYIGDSLYRDNISFSVQPRNLDVDLQLDTIEVYMLNSTNNDTADFYYSVKYIN